MVFQATHFVQKDRGVYLLYVKVPQVYTGTDPGVCVQVITDHRNMRGGKANFYVPSLKRCYELAFHKAE